MRTEEIEAWLSQPDFNCGSVAGIEKHTIDHRPHPISPPASDQSPHRKRRQAMSETPLPTPKRRRIGGELDQDDFDIEDTPRATRRDDDNDALASPSKRRHHHHHSQRVQTASPIPSLSSRSESQSQASGRSSPSKRIAALELNPDGIETRVLSLMNPLLPDSLAEILSELEDCSNGFGVISRACKDEVQEQARTDRSFSLLRDIMYADPSTRDAIGPTPKAADVAWVLEEARECQDMMQSESGWNMGVHFPLLHKAIYGHQRRRQLVGITASTTAKIIKEYLPSDSPAKMVDFSVYVVPDADPSSTETDTKTIVDAVNSLRQVLPCGVINHTDFFPLRNRPVVVSIETKKRGGAQQEAELQIGTWHAAQWKLLSNLIADTGGSFDGLPFLPAIVVHGHEWSFVATTREGSRTILWLEQSFGSTTNAVGVYKIVWGLQRIARWAECNFWPWYKKNALGIDSSAS